MKQHPLLIPEIARLLCNFVDLEDLLSIALTCRVFYHASCFRLWNTLNPKSNRTLRQIKNTLDTTTSYNKYVRKFSLSAKDDHLERFFFHSFLFPNLRELEFSNAAAQDHIVHPIISAAQKSLFALDLSQCYCISTISIRPLLCMTSNQLESLVLYGCGKIDSQVLADVIYRHADTLKRLGLTDINDTILDAIQNCRKLDDLGLEHCTALSNAALTRFFINVVKNKIEISRLRLRDIDSLTSSHLKLIGTSASCLSLIHIDMSECNQVKSDGVCWLARECINLISLSLAYQAGVTNQALQLFISNCHQLKHVDVSGCRLLTDHAFLPLLNAVDDNLIKTVLETLNLSGLNSISEQMIYRLLNKVYSLQELCLGVTYNLDEADRILDAVNNGGETQFFIDYYTIYRVPAMQSRKRLITLSHHERAVLVFSEVSADRIFPLPSTSTWNLPPPVFPL